MRGRDEQDTCREYVLPALRSSGWQFDQIMPEYAFTAGRVVFREGRPDRDEVLRADYLLEISPGFPLAVIEAKREYKKPGDGLEQAKIYAEQLDLPVALSTNGHGIVEFDRRTGRERDLDVFPRPDELWQRYREWRGIVDDTVAEILREPFNRELRDVAGAAKEPRYYQRIAIHRAVAAILRGDKRLLLTMATGTGKTFTALQIVWKIWRYWQTVGDAGIRRVLYLSDRDALIAQPLNRDFKPVFRDEAHRILGEISTSRSICFATYQALDDGSNSPKYRAYPPDFFDLIVVDECHRGSARDESAWRGILRHFKSAIQLGMTATPKRDDNVDTYSYFRRHLYTYSLRQGINDGFLAPYRVQRVVLSPDAHGWRPDPGQLDRFGREVPDGLYTTAEFERIVSITTRTEAAAHYLTNYLKNTDRMAKMAIFCVDAEHAGDMRKAMANANDDLSTQHSDYIARIVSVDGDFARKRLEQFQDEESNTPVVATTAKLLSTGIDIPTLRTVVLFKPIRSMIEFKQIIGRGTRLAPDYDKLSFEIIDFTGATAHFEDRNFDGPADIEIDYMIDDEGEIVDERQAHEKPRRTRPTPQDDVTAPPPHARKYYIDNVEVYIAAEGFYISQPDSDRLRLVEYRDYVAEVVRRLCPTPTSLRHKWRDALSREEIAKELADRLVDLNELIDRTGLTDADPLDILVYVAWNEPLCTRYDRVRRARRNNDAFFARYQPQAREVLDLLLDRYAQHGVGDLTDLRVLELEPFTELGSVHEIVDRFGKADLLHGAMSELQRLLYAA